MLSKRLHDLGYHVYSGCLFPDKEGATKLQEVTSPRLHVIKLDVTDDFQVQHAITQVSELLDGKGKG